MCANSEGPDEIARMCRLVWAFAGRLCDKYHNLMSWLIYPSSTNARIEAFGRRGQTGEYSGSIVIM